MPIIQVGPFINSYSQTIIINHQIQWSATGMEIYL